MANISISKGWDDAKAVIARDGKLLVAVALALIVLPQVVAGVVAPPSDSTGLAGQLLVVAAALIGLAGQLALVRLALGPSISVGEAIGHGFGRFPILLASSILIGIAFFVLLIPVALIAGAMGMTLPAPGEQPGAGASLLILAALAIFLALAPRFMLTAPVVSAEPVGPIRALRRSWELTSGSYWRFFALMLLLLILAVVLMGAAGFIGGIIGRLISPGASAFSTGAFVIALFAALAQAVFTVLTSTLLARIYAQLAGSQANVAEMSE